VRFAQFNAEGGSSLTILGGEARQCDTDSHGNHRAVRDVKHGARTPLSSIRDPPPACSIRIITALLAVTDPEAPIG
jgi:hypothetical protein